MTPSDQAPEISGRVDWYAIYTRHQHEKTVAEILSSAGIEVFLPQYSAIRQWKDRTKHLKMPLFPCYVFLHGGLDRRLRVLSTPGVFSFVSSGARPAAIEESEIEAIRRAVKSNLRVEPYPFLRCGDRVRIRTGALAGVEGLLVRKRNSCRLILSATLLGKSIAVEVDARCVEPISLRATGIPLGVNTAQPWKQESAAGKGLSWRI
jgi:transcription antitermination factor NusG